MEQLATAPGFIRRFNFTDGPHYTLLALWRTAADAHAFFSSDEHQAAMRELFRHRWQYSHFAGLWEMTAPRRARHLLPAVRRRHARDRGHAARDAAPSCSIPSPPRAMSTAELAAFLGSTLPAQIRAERALHNGDVTPRLSTWSHHDPVTLFGAGVPFRSGWSDVRAVFDWLAATFTGVRRLRLRAHRRRCERRSRVHGRHRALPGDDRLGRTVVEHAACHARLPTRGRRLEDRPSARRPHARGHERGDAAEVTR